VATDTWNIVALPILEYVAELELEGPVDTNSTALAAALSVSHGSVLVEMRRLIDDGFVAAEQPGGSLGSNEEDYFELRLAERGARVVGRWPADDPFDSLLALLDRRLADPAIDVETKSKLRKLRSTLGEIGKTTAGAVLSAYLKAVLCL
jgi:hypothetical protein